jgi:predicted nuclease of predicted toxin-antitoxin system
LAIALEERRFILTHDSDFGTLAINEGVPCYGIIYLRLKDLRVDNVKGVLNKFLKIGKEIGEGSIVILKDKQVRIRPIVR